MTPIKQISELPDFMWTSHTREEIMLNGSGLVGKTDIIYQIGNVAVCGFVWFSFVQPPWMWMALAEGIGLRELIDFRAWAMRIPTGTMTAVRSGYAAGVRFAEFYGFSKMETETEHAGNKYLLFKKD